MTSERHGARLARHLSIAGFSLLEAMIAMAIGGFGLMAVARLQLGLQAESDLAKQLGLPYKKIYKWHYYRKKNADRDRDQ